MPPDQKPKSRLTVSTMLLTIWVLAALLATGVSQTGEGAGAWSMSLSLTTLATSIVLPAVVIGLWHRATLDAVLAQVGLTASFWNALWLLPVSYRFAAMVMVPALGLIIASIAGRSTGVSFSRLRSPIRLIKAASLNILGSVLIFLPMAFALNRYGWVRAR
jgi:hypothetical protein